MTGFAFTGEPRDANGLQYHRARYYNPTLAGWLSLDPVEGAIGRPMSLNGYLYVNGNPVMNIDPTGMFSRTRSLTPGLGGGSRRTRRTRRTRRPTRNRGTVRTRVPVRTTGASEVKTRSTTSPLVHGVPAAVSSAASEVKTRSTTSPLVHGAPVAVQGGAAGVSAACLTFILGDGPFPVGDAVCAALVVVGVGGAAASAVAGVVKAVQLLGDIQLPEINLHLPDIDLSGLLPLGGTPSLPPVPAGAQSGLLPYGPTTMAPPIRYMWPQEPPEFPDVPIDPTLGLDQDDYEQLANALVQGVRGVQNVLQFARSRVKATTTTSNQTCADSVKNTLQKEVKRHCKKPKFSCSDQDRCNVLRRKWQRADRCKRARRDINRECFGGGNEGHIQAENEAKQAWNNCLKVYRDKRC